MQHHDKLRHRARLLSRCGLSDQVVADALGISRGTVMTWRHAGFPPAPKRPAAWIPSIRAYPYLLGLYLGDGSIAQHKASFTLDLACDGQYTGVLQHATIAMETVFPTARVRTVEVPMSRCVHLQLTHQGVPRAFPQHGPGRKHERKIELAPWQRVLTARTPDALVRGLIHSDGSRCINQVNTTLPSGREAHYEYVRYFFTNYSADIRRIFCEHCELLGIRWTQSNARNISISHRESVAILERIVGPKS